MVFTNILTKHQNNFIHTKCVVLLRRGGIYIRRRRSYKDIIYMSNMLKVYELFCLYLLVVLNLGRMNEMRDCNLKFGVVTLYYTGVIYLLIDYEMFVYICLLLYFNTHFEQHSCVSSGFTKWK